MLFNFVKTNTRIYEKKGPYNVADYFFLIRGTFWFDAGSRIIENNLRGCFFLLLAPVGDSKPVGPYPSPFPNPAGQS